MFDTIYLDNHYRVFYEISHRDADTNELGPSTALVLNVRLSATRGGSAIHTEVNKSAPELTGLPGTYACVFEGSELREHLVGLSSVWVVVATGVGAILCSNRVAVQEHRKAA